MKALITTSPPTVFNQLPKVWTDIATGQQIQNFHKATEQVIYDNGFRDVVQPSFNTETHKRDNTPVYDEANDWVTYGTIALTQQEIDTREQQALDSDQSATDLQTDISNGQIMYQRFFAYLKRRIFNGTLTGVQARNSAMLLWNALLPINYGQFLVAKMNLNGLTEPSDEKELEVLNLVKDQVNDYLSTS